MSRPDPPRRTSTGSDTEDVTSKSKSHRKTFVVGGAAKNHHRIPSYGKKLNQLGKMTALTTADAKPPSDAADMTSSPRRASIHRSASQKSLTDVKGPKRTGSSQNLQKLKRSGSHHGSTARMPSLKPMTKVDNSRQGKANSTVSNTGDVSVPNGSHGDSATVVNKRATFVIEDDEDEFDDVASSFANEALSHDQRPMEHRKENKPLPTQDTQAADELQEQSNGSPINGLRSITQDNVDSEIVASHSGAKQQTGQQAHLAARHSGLSVRATSGSAGLLYHSVNVPADPQLTTDTAVSKDIQTKDVMNDTSSVKITNGHSIPNNSQPLTSRFLESPRKDALRSTSTLLVTGTPKEGEFHGPSSLQHLPRSNMATLRQSPQSSTANLGAAASRTQQKLMLQRASSIRDFGAGAEDRSNNKGGISPHPRAQKEIDRISREYKNVQRFRDPMRELSTRLYARGIATPNAQPLRRTMTQMALVDSAAGSEVRTPRASQSTANLRLNQTSFRDRQIGPGNCKKILADLWRQNEAWMAEAE